MGASILWLPEDPRKPKSLHAMAPSSFIEAMERAGFRIPCTISAADLPRIDGMAALFGREEDRPNPYQEIVDAVQEHGAIRIWAQY